MLFTFVSKNVSVDVDPQEVGFTLQGEISFTYTATAPSAAGPYTFSGTLRDSGG